ncbi:MAG: hypothetical protein ACLTA5_04710 [Anaerococcus obesiensis]
MGDKLELEINMDKRSQDLAYFALAVTFSENAAYGRIFGLQIFNLGGDYVRRMFGDF